MKQRILLWFAVASCISLCLGSQQCNEFVDDILNKMKADKEFFQEPYEIPEEERSFGLYEVESGYIYGLTTLHRTHDAEPKKKGSVPHLKVYLGAGELKVQCTVKKKFLNFGKSAKVDAKIPLANIELDIVPKDDGTNPEIKGFKIDEVKGLTVKVSGTGLIKDFLLNAFVLTFGRFFKNAVKTAVEVRLKKFLKDTVQEFAIPAECLSEAFK